MVFKSLKIGKKLIISFIVVSLISSIAGFISLFLMKSSDAQYSDALINYGFSQGDIGLLYATMNDSCTNILMTIASDNASDIQQAKATIQENIAAVSKYMKAIEPTLVGETEQAAFAAISENLPEFSEHAKEVMALSSQNRNEEALKVYQGDAMEHIKLINENMQKLMDSNQTNGNSLSISLSSRANRLVLQMLFIILVALAISITLAVYISRSIARPMGECSERIKKLSKGDLASPVPVVNTKDETGELAEATGELVVNLKQVIQDMTEILGEMAKGNLNVKHERAYQGDFYPLHTSMVQIIDAFNTTLGQINQSAEQVNSGAEQVSVGAQSLSQGATEQASAVEELAATINDISSQIKNNANNAMQAREKANIVGGQMTESNQQMQDMVSAMSEISVCSNEIGKIIKTIEDIAFQTNILALNAAVEAARAGAAGKGFAVVADEVRNLASKSAEASKNTAVLIENSIKAVGHGTSIADETAKSLLMAVEGVKEVTAFMDQISTATETQAESISQVTQGVDQISSVVQTNSATSEESAAASEELSGQAQIMKELIAKFNLRNQFKEIAAYQPSAGHAPYQADNHTAQQYGGEIGSGGMKY